jgi:hypothetical protein
LKSKTDTSIASDNLFMYSSPLIKGCQIVNDPAEGAALNQVTQSFRRFCQWEGLCLGTVPSHTESDLRQAAIDEYFASCHKAAVIGGEEQAHGSCFVWVAHTFKWCMTGKTGKKSFLHSRLRQPH